MQINEIFFYYDIIILFYVPNYRTYDTIDNTPELFHISPATNPTDEVGKFDFSFDIWRSH